MINILYYTKKTKNAFYAFYTYYLLINKNKTEMFIRNIRCFGRKISRKDVQYIKLNPSLNIL